MPHALLKGFDCHFEYDDFGHQEIIVLSHSLGANLLMWEKQVAILSPHFNILRYDTRGHGASGCSATVFDIAALGQDVVALLDFLKIDQPVCFCGLSLGGLVGQWLGIHEPQRFKKLVLANTAAKIGNYEIWDQRIALVIREGLTGLRQATAERWFTASFRKSEPQIVDAILFRFLQTNPQGYAHCCAAIRDADFRNQLREIRPPTFLISGDNDPVTTTADAAFMAQRIPDVRHATLHAAHLSNIEKPEEFSKYFLSFAKH